MERKVPVLELFVFLEPSTPKSSNRGAAEPRRGHRLAGQAFILSPLLPCLFPSSLAILGFQLILQVNMKPSTRLLQHACRITFFTRQNCMLCTNAKSVLSDVWDKRPFEYKEIDVMAPEGKSWKDFYEFDTPVVCPFRALLKLWRTII